VYSELSPFEVYDRALVVPIESVKSSQKHCMVPVNGSDSCPVVAL